MLTDKILFSSTVELLALMLLFGGVATVVPVVCMLAMFGKNALSVAIDGISVQLSITSSVIDAEHDAVEVNGSSVEAVATLTLL